MAKVKLSCPICSKEFERAKKEYNRSIKVGRPQYCSRSCAAKGNSKNLGEHLGNASTIAGKGKKWSRDEYTPFRYFLRNAKQRTHSKGKTNLDLIYLKELWDLQDGKCPFTGWALLLPRSNKYPGNTNSIYRASLDRIDNDKGYVKGNVRFISVIANYCRNTFTDEDVKLFCEAVVRNKP